MDAVFEYHIPVLHPLMVHFPVSFLLAAAGAAIVWTFKGSPFWRRCSLFLLVLGTAGAFMAYFTGEQMEEQGEGIAIVEELVGLHERMALYTLVGGCVATAAMAAVSIMRGPGLAIRILVGLVVLLVAVLVTWTAHIGSTMVWGVAG